jgi:hypothetical protein
MEVSEVVKLFREADGVDSVDSVVSPEKLQLEVDPEVDQELGQAQEEYQNHSLLSAPDSSSVSVIPMPMEQQASEDSQISGVHPSENSESLSSSPSSSSLMSSIPSASVREFANATPASSAHTVPASSSGNAASIGVRPSHRADRARMLSPHKLKLTDFVGSGSEDGGVVSVSESASESGAGSRAQRIADGLLELYRAYALKENGRDA